MDLSKHTKLESLTIENVEDLILPSLTKLKQLSCDNEVFKKINFENLVDLERLYMYGQLSDFDLPDLKKLEILSVSDNWLYNELSGDIAIDIDNFPSLESVLLKGNIKANLSNLPRLSFLNLKGNVESINIQNTPKLKSVTLRDTKKVDFINAWGIKYLSLLGNCGEIESLLLPNLERLNIIDFEWFNSSDFSFPSLNNLRFISLMSQKNLAPFNLDLSNKKYLEEIYLEDVSINNLDLTGSNDINTIHIKNSNIKTLICTKDLKEIIAPSINQIENIIYTE